ncbi:MAG: hypothetical protein ACKOAX_00080, partial [Candidatus Kapaibacterium sp.]
EYGRRVRSQSTVEEYGRRVRLRRPVAEYGYQVRSQRPVARSTDRQRRRRSNADIAVSSPTSVAPAAAPSGRAAHR